MEISNITNASVLSQGISKKRVSKAKLIAAFALFSLIGAAFYFSAQPASISKLQSGNVLELFKMIGFENVSMHFVRKLAHFTLFGTIGAAFAFALSFKISGIKLFNISFFLGTFMGIIDETHQMFVPGRGPQIKDVMIDSAGAFFGVLIVVAIVTIVKNKTKQA